MTTIDSRARIRNIVRSAIEGCTYAASHKDGDRVLVLEARRANGKQVSLRFLGLRSSDTDSEPAVGAPLRLASVGGPDSSLLRFFTPRVLRTPSHSARVRIENRLGEARNRL